MFAADDVSIQAGAEAAFVLRLAIGLSVLAQQLPVYPEILSCLRRSGPGCGMGLSPEEDHDGEEKTQARTDNCEVAPSSVDEQPGHLDGEGDPFDQGDGGDILLLAL